MNKFLLIDPPLHNFLCAPPYVYQLSSRKTAKAARTQDALGNVSLILDSFDTASQNSVYILHILGFPYFLPARFKIIIKDNCTRITTHGTARRSALFKLPNSR